MRVIGFYPLNNFERIEILSVNYDEMHILYKLSGDSHTHVAELVEEFDRDYNGDFEEDYDLYIGFHYGDRFIALRDIREVA